MNLKITLLLFLAFVSKGISQTKIVLTKDQLLPLTHFEISSDYGKLIDGITNIDETYAPTLNSSSISWPHKVLIDLRGVYNISQLKAFDGYNTPTINWYAGTTPFNTTKIAGPISLTGWGSYNTQNVSANASANGVRYIILEQLENLSKFPSEIEIYGTAISTDTPVIATVKPVVEAKQLLGSNGFLWEDANNVGLFPNLRAFTENQWFFDTNQKLMVSPSNSGGVNMKTQLTSFKNKDTETVIVFQKSPNYIMNQSSGVHNGDYKPIDYSIIDYNTPANWLEIAKTYYKFAAYLGTQQASNADMNFNTTPRWNGDVVNVEESGLNLAKWVEILNEPDKNWASPVEAGYYAPYTLASLLSAAYDGHQGTMAKAGVKTADPNMKVAMGGIYKLQVEYIRAMHEWAKANRPDKKFPADAINFHHYNNNDNTGGQGTGTAAMHPEAGQLITQMQQVVDYRNKYLPNVEIWLSEWGCSTNNGNLKVPSLPSLGTREDVQGAWMIRTYLTLMKLNIDRSYMYATEDENDPNGNSLFGGVGILKYGTLEKKKSYYYVTDFVNLFRNKNFKLKQDLSTASVKDYVFEDNLTNKEMRFIWSPTGNETTVANYNVNITGANVTGYQFTGSAHAIDNLSNSNTITVTEIPRVYIYDKTALDVTENEKKAFVVYPNPTSGKVSFSDAVQTVTLYNMVGMELATFDLNKKTPEINLEKYPTGGYILKIITSDNKTIQSKVIKK